MRLHGQTCNNLSVVSLDEDCSVEVTPDMVLEGTPSDSSYVVRLTTLGGLQLGNVLTGQYLGYTLLATVTDTLTGNSCWGLLVAEDKWKPDLTCTNLTLNCAVPDHSPAYLRNVLGITAAEPVVVENCGVFNLSYKDTWTDLDCDDPLDRSAVLERVWTATDASGNQNSCVQYLDFQRIHPDQVVFPADTILDCAQPVNAGPAVAGSPYVSALGRDFPLFPDQAACELAVAYQDQILPLCGGSYTILRTWTVVGDCPPSDWRTKVQIIKVQDKSGPVMTCPGDMVVSTDPFQCKRTLDLPDLLLSDNCSSVTALRADWTVDGQPFSLQGTLTDFPGNNPWNPDTMGRLAFAEDLPAGIVTMKYTATDACDNTTTCTFRVTISDGVVPWAVCDEFTQVALGISGEALVNASTFDDGSGDNCSPVQFKARRVAANDCQDTDHFFSKVKFCCSDVGDTIDVIFRVYDLPVDTGAISLTEAEDHSSECLVKVFVEDKIKPVCLPPLQTSVSCVNLDLTLESYGMPVYADNCCLDTFFELPPNYSLFDTLCNRGTISRTFRAFDCHGLSSQCTQRILVGSTDQYYGIKFPDDVFVSDCDTTGVYSPGPQIFGSACSMLAISYQDHVSTGGILSCYWIERRWQVIDWCRYDPNLPLIEVPNPNPAPDPLDIQNIPGPIVAPAGFLPEPTTMRITANDPSPTDFSSFWNAEANGYVYRQIISVRDNQPPQVRGCPVVTGPIPICDHTANDPQFWNAPYWKHPMIDNSHDLCEGKADLAVTASDGCSKGNVGVRYFLFLDLDGDGVQETVINSINPPPPNTVYYGNALNLGYVGGEPRAFDQRPVPPEEKYRFAIQKGGFVNVTGYVRWTTQKDPGTYVIPQLPHGVHRIQWIINDGCGNETICEYPIEIKDCHIPDLVCLNGLSVDITPDKSITLYANDFLWYVGDNCTPSDQITLALRKSGTGHDFPTGANGIPPQSVTFTCDELGPQFVELWAKDRFGNANVCETYVIVQDNFGICPATLGTVAGFVQTEKGKGLEDAIVQLDGSHPALPAIGIFDHTNPDGTYRFSNALPFGINLTLTPLKDNDPLNGVSTFDLVLINKHILGQVPFTSPYQMIAADANGSGSLTTFDVVELRKLILGIYNDLPNNTSWRFVAKNFAFPNPANPFQTPFPESRQLANLQSNMLQEDFVAVKIGDVNGNVITSSAVSATDRSSGLALFTVSSSAGNWLEAGEEFQLTLEADTTLLGCQFTLAFSGLDVLGLQPGEALTEENVALFPDEQAMTLSWNGDGRPSFVLHVRARKAGSLRQMLQVSSRITRAEAYRIKAGGGDNDAELLQVALRFAAGDGFEIAGQEFELYPNQANPWHSRTQIRFYLPRAQTVSLSVFDQSGSLLFSQKQFLEAGHQIIPLQAADVADRTGVLIYRLDAETDSAVGKMQRF